ncbi:hypothetical protein [Actinoplanes sp. NPDC051494]|uniref:hypothetical protein n=1 Tax=Actinoplanes sp. NPDC051494 TaxID=3363907 RepID=UPI0037B013A6
MARQVRNRVTAIVFGGFLLGAAVATTGTANAGQVGSGGRQVVFAGGGMMGLSCRSTPSIESLTVPAESTLRVVNRTGWGAKLLLNGDSRGTVADDATTEVVFRQGTTAVLLDPGCPIGEQTTPVMVTATPTTTPFPDETLTPPEPPDGEASVDPSDSVEPSASGPDSGTTPATESPEPSPTTAEPGPVSPPAPTTHSPATSGTSGSTRTAAPFVPLGRKTPKVNTDPMTGTESGGGPVLSGIPAGDEKVALDGVPDIALPATTTEAAPPLDAGSDRPVAAAEPVMRMTPITPSRPIGLLTLVAVVCVLGVGTGAIRAFVSERASRASLA